MRGAHNPVPSTAASPTDVAASADVEGSARPTSVNRRRGWMAKRRAEIERDEPTEEVGVLNVQREIQAEACPQRRELTRPMPRSPKRSWAGSPGSTRSARKTSVAIASMHAIASIVRVATARSRPSACPGINLVGRVARRRSDACVTRVARVARIGFDAGIDGCVALIARTGLERADDRPRHAAHGRHRAVRCVRDGVVRRRQADLLGLVAVEDEQAILRGRDAGVAIALAAVAVLVAQVEAQLATEARGRVPVVVRAPQSRAMFVADAPGAAGAAVGLAAEHRAVAVGLRGIAEELAGRRAVRRLHAVVANRWLATAARPRGQR